MTERVIINNFGDTRPVCAAFPSWRIAYELYLIGYEAAADKVSFNANYGGNHGDKKES